VDEELPEHYFDEHLICYSCMMEYFSKKSQVMAVFTALHFNFSSLQKCSCCCSVRKSDGADHLNLEEET
jgi:hypothetical protein